MSNHLEAAKGQIAPTVLLPGDPLRAKYLAEHYLENPVCHNTVRNMLGYTGTYKGVPISIQGTGMGMPSMGIYSWELIKDYGCQNLIRIGTAGSFSKKLKVRDIIVGLSASTDSNYAHAFNLPGAFAPTASETILTHLGRASLELGIPVHGGNIVSCDVFYETNPDWWTRWANMGVIAVEMEAAALYMNAAYLGAEALAIMTISNDLLTGEDTTQEEREKTFTEMMELSLETAIHCETNQEVLD